LQVGINQTLEDRMFEMAGKPTRCPHGEPIPSRDGIMPRLNDMSLVTLKTSSKARISRVRASDPEKLRYFADLGLKPEQPITLISTSPFNGPLRISAGAREHVLGHDLAALLWVDLI